MEDRLRWGLRSDLARGWRLAFRAMRDAAQRNSHVFMRFRNTISDVVT